MSLVHIQPRCVVRRLVACPSGRLGHVSVANEPTISCDDVGISSHAIAPVGRVLDVLRPCQLLRHVVTAHPIYNGLSLLLRKVRKYICSLK